MKKIISLLLLLPILSITGCSKLKSDTAIHSLMSKDDEVIELSPIELINLVEERYGMTVLFYTEHCSFCDRARDAIKEMAKKYDYAFFQIEINSQNGEYLLENFKVCDIGDLGYPSIRLFENAKLNYSNNSADILNYSSLRRVLVPQLIETETYYQDIKLPN